MINSNDRIVKHKLGLLNLAEEQNNVSRACKVWGRQLEHTYRAGDQVRVIKKLREHGGFVSLTGVRSTWLQCPFGFEYH